MKAFIKKQATIISVDDEPVLLENIDENGVAKYRVTYHADPVAAAKNKAFLVDIVVTSEPITKKSVTTFAGETSAESVLNNILTKEARNKDLTKSQKQDINLIKKSDITAFIPNKLAPVLTNPAFSQSPVLSVNRTIGTRQVAEMQKKNMSTPVLVQNLNKSSLVSEKANDQKIREITNDMIFLNGVEPANITNLRSNTISPASKTLFGITPVFPVKSTQDSSGVPMEDAYMGSLLNKKTVLIQQDLDKQDFIDVFVQEQRNYALVDESFTISEGAIKTGNFYVTLQVKNSKQAIVQTLSIVVNHAKNVKIYEVPDAIPKVRVSPVNKPGKVSFEVARGDKKTKGLKIYKKEINSDVPSVGSEYSYVGKVVFRTESGFQRVEDQISNTNPTIYRFVPFANESYQSALFASVLVSSDQKNLTPASNIKKRPKYIAIDYETTLSSGINIFLKNIPAGPVALKLLKRDLSLYEKEYTLVGNTTYAIDSSSDAPIIINDKAVKPNRIYEYIVKYIFRQGDEIVASANLVVEYTPVSSNIINTTIQNLVVSDDSSKPNVTFTIAYEPIANNTENIKQFLRNQGLSTEFQDQIINDRAGLDKLFATQITRTNLVNGEIENFGIINSLDFSDRKFSKVKNVKPLASGYEYKYTATTFLRNPETLLPNLTRPVQTSTNNSYQLSPFKWRQPITLNKGNLVSEATLRANHAKPQLALGDVADIQSVNVSLAKAPPSISSAEATRVIKGSVLLQWKVDGNLAKVDHFIVLMDKNGIRQTIGNAHNISSNNYFEMVDPLTNGESGAFKYIIIPVLYDGTRGTEKSTNIVVI